jgi:hypothetical protein
MNSSMDLIKRYRYFTQSSVKLNACPKRNKAGVLDKERVVIMRILKDGGGDVFRCESLSKS